MQLPFPAELNILVHQVMQLIQTHLFLVLLETNSPHLLEMLLLQSLEQIAI